MNNKSVLLHAHGSPIQFVGKSMIVEACAIRKCVEKAIQHGWRKLYVLSDAKGVVDVLRKNMKTTWDIDVVCEDIWNIFASLEHIVFVHIPRRFNVVAHNVAKFSISLLSEFSWERLFPTWIVNDVELSFGQTMSRMN
ncbi:hypothetical protein AABB24_003701 [Solanum stoloniferum]